MSKISEIIPKKAIDGLIKTDKAITELDKSTLKFVESVAALSKALKSGNITFKDVQKAQNQAANQKKQLTVLEKEQLSAEKALDRQRQQGIKQLQKLALKEAQLEAALRKEVKTEADLIARTNALVAVRKNLDRTTDSGKRKHAALTAEIKKNTASLKAQDNQILRNQRNVGNYGSALTGAAGKAKLFAMQLAGALGLTSGLFLLIGALKSGIRMISAFGKALSSLSAITGAVGKDLEFYANKSKEFAKASLLSATDILKAFEKVGSIRPELLRNKEALAAVTEQAIILSEATGGTLGVEGAAIAAAGAMNQFGLASNEATKVVDILVAAQTFGTATVAELAETFKNFGVVADASNLTLIQAAALAETLAKKMIIGSEAGTKLTSSLISLKKAGVGYASGQFDVSDALREVNAELNELGTAYEKDQRIIEVFGKKNITIGETLLRNIDYYEDLTLALDVNGIALEKQKTQNDNLSGSMSRLGSAWEVFNINLGSSNGLLKTFIDNVTNAINSVSDVDIGTAGSTIGIFALRLFGIGDEAIEKAQEEIKTFYQRVNALSIKEIEDTIPVQERIIEGFRKDGNKKAIKREERRLSYMKKRIEELTEIARIEEEKRTDDAKTESDLRIAIAKTEADKLKEFLVIEEDERQEIIGDGIDWEFSEKQDAREKEKQAEKEFSDYMREQWEAEFKANIERIEKELEAEELAAEKRKELEEERVSISLGAINVLSAAGDAFFAARQTQLTAESAAMAKAKAYELELEVGNQDEINAINEKYAKKEAELKTKQAKAQKRQQIFSAIINIAASIPAMFTAGPAGIVLAAFAAAIGAISLATIIAQPIPQFYKGTESAPKGLVSVGERGRELIETKAGKMFMATAPTILSGIEGAKIKSNPETERIMRWKESFGYDSQDLKGTLIKNNQDLMNTIKNKREFHYSARKREITERSGNYYKRYKNIYFG